MVTPEERELQSLRRRGISEIEIITFILNSPRHCELFSLLQKQSWHKLITNIENLNHPKKQMRENAVENLGKLGKEGQLAIPSIIQKLEDRFFTIRQLAFWSLGEITKKATGEITEVVVQVLIAKLFHPKPEIRLESASTLGELKEMAKPAIPALIKALQDSRQEVRAIAATALGQMGRNAKEAIPSLIQALENDEGFVRCNSAEALGKIGKLTQNNQIFPVLIEGLRDASDLVSRENAKAIVLLGESKLEKIPDLLNELLAGLKGSNKNYRIQTQYIISELLPHQPEYVPQLTSHLELLLNQENARLRQWSSEMLGDLGKEAKDAVPALIQSLKDPFLSEESAQTLGKIGAAALIAIPALFELLSKEKDLSQNVVHSLKQISKNSVEASSVMIREHLSHLNPKVREVALEVLHHIYMDLPAIIPDLIQSLQDPNEQVRLYALEILSCHKPNALDLLEPILALLATETKSTVREMAVTLLGEFGKEAAKAIPFLLGMLTEKNVVLRSCVVKTLGKIGEQSEVIIPFLQQQFKATDTYFQSSLVVALGYFGQKAKGAIPQLVEALRKQEISYHYQIIETIGNIGNIGLETEKLVPFLTPFLKNRSLKTITATTLGKLGISAKGAIPALIQILEKEIDLTIHPNTIRALGDIGIRSPEVVSALKRAKNIPYTRQFAVEALDILQN